MNIIVHHPQNAKDASALQKRAALIHAQAVLDYMQKLPCPKEQKLRLLKEIEQARLG